MVQDFCARRAPLLLMLWNLGPATRSQLQHAARARAVLVQADHRLYPEVVDERAIKAALVESVMRAAAEPSDACGKSSRTGCQGSHGARNVTIIHIKGTDFLICQHRVRGNSSSKL